MARKTPASEDAGYCNTSTARTLRIAQIRKQFLLGKLLLRTVAEALDRDNSRSQFIIPDNDGVARLQSIREAQRFPEFHLDRGQFHYETRVAQALRKSNRRGLRRRAKPCEIHFRSDCLAGRAVLCSALARFLERKHQPVGAD